MTERQPIVKPLGLWTAPGLYGATPPGAMRECHDLVMRAPALLSAAPVATFVTTIGAADGVIHAMSGILGGRMITFERSSAGVWTERTDTTAATPVSMSPSTRTYSQTGRLCIMRARNRVFANTTTSRPVVFDTDNPSALPQTLRYAGIPQTHARSITVPTTNGIALPANKCAGYAFCIRRKFADGYEVLSRPSPIYIVNTAGVGATCNPTFQVMCNGDNVSVGGHQVGDIVEMYRTDVLDTVVLTTDPGTTLKLVKSYTLTSTDVANIACTIEDTQPPGPFGVTFGKQLYTNPGVGGLLSVNRIPEISHCMAYFKDFAFYGNILQRPQWEFQIPGGIASTVNGAFSTGFNTTGFRAHGIGIRRISGTTVVGSPTITGVALADFNGLAIGQRIMSTQFSSGDSITALNSGAGTITMSANAIAAVGPGNIDFSDWVEFTVDGATLGKSWGVYGNNDLRVQEWVLSLFTGGGRPALEVTTSESLTQAQDATVGIKTNTWVFEPWIPNTATTFGVRATNGQNYSPPVPSMTDSPRLFPYREYKNLLRWSKNGQPEHCPPAAPINETLVGGSEIIALVPTRDALWVFCTDGLYRLSGAGGQWRVDPVDTTLVLASPRGACSLKDVVYAYTNRGVVRVSDAGVDDLSDDIISDLLPGSEYAETASIIVEANQQDEEIVVRIDATQVFVYATRHNLWSTVGFASVTAMTYWRYPVSGAPCLAYADLLAAQPAAFFRWNATASFRAPRARFQPIYSKDPFSGRQSQDMVVVFAPENAGQVITPMWNNNIGTGVTLKGGAAYAHESRAMFGVPRAYALAHSISVGWRGVTLTQALKFYGLAVTSDNETIQHLKR